MGDKKNAIKKLQQSLRSIKYPSSFDVKEMEIGSPREYLKLFHYLFMDYNPLIAREILLKHNMELNSKSDKAFIDGVYKVIRDMFAYVPKLNRDQFFTAGFAQVKALVACEMIGFIQGKLKTLQPPSVSCMASSGSLLSQPSTSRDRTNNVVLPSPSLPKSLSNNSINSKVLEIRQKHRTDTSEHVQTPCLEDSAKPNTQSDYSLITKSLENFNSKYEILAKRLIPLESRINTTMDAVTEVEQNTESSVSLSDFNRLLSRVSAMERENENLKDRIIILESQNMSKHLTPFRDRESMDRAGDATLFHSFIDNNSGMDEEEAYYSGKSVDNGNQGRMYQGEAVDFQENDCSVGSIDLTPTLVTSMKTPKFTIENNIMRAKELVSKASLLSNHMKSM